MIHTQSEIDNLVELAIIQRAELKKLVESLPQLRDHLSSEIERNLEEIEPAIRSELEQFVTARALDAHAQTSTALTAKIDELARSLETTTAARYSVLIAEREKNESLLAQAEARIAEAASALPGSVKEIVAGELARFPRAGEIDQLRKEFAEPKGLNPRGKWSPDETYQRLDLVTFNGDSFVSNIDGNRERPSRSAADWTLNAARGNSGGGGGVTTLTDLLPIPTSGQILGTEGTSYVPKLLVAGSNITITESPTQITISGDEGQIELTDGTAAAPSLFFVNDPDTGIYRPSANTLGISTSGVQRLFVDEDGVTTVGGGAHFDGEVRAANGNANHPTFSFTSDQDTGIYRHGANELGISIGGTEKAVFTSTTFTITPNLVVSGTGTINGTTIPASKTLVVTTDKISALAATTSAELAGVISDETGTGSLVFANSPTLVTPDLGTPSALVGTNITGTAAGLTAGNVTTNANLTGDVTSVGNATSIAAGVIVDADINASAGIVDTKLATISTASKVSNSATTATSANTASAIVARDASGNFTASTITANLTGNVSGSSGSTTGNAATATALQTARAINGVNFDGTAPITVTADAGTLTGATLAAGVTASSLTSLGTIANLTATAGTVATTPTASTDIANKLYVDTVAQGLDAKASCVAATTADITLSGAQTIDGVSVVAGNRVLVKNQSLSQNNGIYLCASGSWTRTTDADTWDELTSAFTFIEQGTVNADTGYVCTANAGGTLGTTALPWSQFSGAGTFTAGTGLTLTGSVFSLTSPVAVANGGTGLTSLGSGVATFLGTPSSANLAAAVSDETGSGALVFATSPTLVTPNLGAASATSLAASGTVTGSNLSGTNTGDQTTISGNAGSATILQTARNINGVSFNGSADITVAAAAGTLTGNTLASGVTASSLTSVGTIASLVATTADINGGTIDGTTIGASTPSTGSFTTLNGAAIQTIESTVTGRFIASLGDARVYFGTLTNHPLQFQHNGTNVGQLTSTGLNSTAIGATTPSTGAFTTLSASGNSTFTGTGSGNALSIANTVAGNFSGVITQNLSTGATAFARSGNFNSSNGVFLDLTSTGYSGAYLSGGPSGQSANLFTTANFPLVLGVNSAAIGTFTSTGLAVTGALSATGNGTFSGNGATLTFSGTGSPTITATNSDLKLTALAASADIIIDANRNQYQKINGTTRGLWSSTGLAVTGALSCTGSATIGDATTTTPIRLTLDGLGTAGNVPTIRFKNAGVQKAFFGLSGGFLGTTATDALVGTDFAGGAVVFTAGDNGLLQMRITTSGVAIGNTDQFGGGAGVIAIKSATTVPASNPTGGGVLYVEGGALKFRGSSGTVTTIANA